MNAPKRPKTKARLEQLITQWQKDSGQPVARLNLRVAAMMLAGALARVIDDDGDMTRSATLWGRPVRAAPQWWIR